MDAHCLANIYMEPYLFLTKKPVRLCEGRVYVESPQVDLRLLEGLEAMTQMFTVLQMETCPWK